MVLLGYEPDSKTYKVFNPVLHWVHVTHDVIFDEAVSWDLQEHEAMELDIFTIE